MEANRTHTALPPDTQPGDLVHALIDIHNDGGIPDLPEQALIASAGTRGVIVNIGHLEGSPDRAIFLVRFEGADRLLSPPTGCWAEELSPDAPV